MTARVNLLHVRAWRRKEAAVLARLTPPGSDVREVRALLKSALGKQYGAWVRMQAVQQIETVLYKGGDDMDEQERRERVRQLQDQGVRLGVDWRYLPGAGELDDDGGKARRNAERMQDFAGRFGLRVCDLDPDMEIFQERGE